MADRSRFMRPVNVFPSTGIILHCMGRRRQGHQSYRRSPHLQTILTVLRNPEHASAIGVSACIFMATFVGATPQTPANAIAEIQSLLRTQQDAWNRGNIDEFMNGYAKSAATVFVSDDEVRRGWETVRDRYRQKYSDRTKMGTLGFSDI